MHGAKRLTQARTSVLAPPDFAGGSEASAGLEAAPSTADATASDQLWPPSVLQDCLKPGVADRTTASSVVLLTTAMAGSGERP